MTFDIQPVVQSKNNKRRQLANMPVEEKLKLLDVLRERTLALHSASRSPNRVPAARLAAQAALENK